jgi:hypothetical protein
MLDKSTHKDVLFILSTKASLNDFTLNVHQNMNYKKLIYISSLLGKITNFLAGRNSNDDI